MKPPAALHRRSLRRNTRRQTITAQNKTKLFQENEGCLSHHIRRRTDPSDKTGHSRQAWRGVVVHKLPNLQHGHTRNARLACGLHTLTMSCLNQPSHLQVFLVRQLALGALVAGDLSVVRGWRKSKRAGRGGAVG